MGVLSFNNLSGPSLPLSGLGATTSRAHGLDVRVETMPYGLSGTTQTVERMKQAVIGKLPHAKHHEGMHHPEVRFLATRIVNEVPSKDYAGEARAIFEFMHIPNGFMRYTLDPRGLEWVQTPYVTLLVEGQGDCDDHATAICALAGSLGLGCGVRTIKADKKRPDQFSHVYAIIGVRQNGRTTWYPADSTEYGARFGQDPPGSDGLPTQDWIFVEA